MGMLDDAIREHLELKKRSGAPDEEVLRLESEVFGPARSAAVPPQPAADGALEPEPAPSPEPAPGPAFDPETVAEHEPVVPVAEPPTPEPPAPEPPPAAAAPPPRPVEPEPWLDEDPDEVPATEALDHSTAGRPTTEFTAAEAAEAAGAPPAGHPAPDEKAEDVLEETPDFLQETPEHDRLWFEQKPPRDFDFDE